MSTPGEILLNVRLRDSCNYLLIFRCNAGVLHDVTLFLFPLQTELDNVNALLSEAEGKSIKASKDWSSVESQLQDVQVRALWDFCRPLHLSRTR